MPDGVDLPSWLTWIIVAGVVAGALSGIVALMILTGRGVRWVGLVTRRVVLAPARENDRRIEEKLDAVIEQLTSDNGGSIREQVNGTRSDLMEHVRLSAQDRAEMRDWLQYLDPDGPPGRTHPPDRH